MTTFTIQESGMDFGPFNADHCFSVEKSSAYQAIDEGVKIAEFVWLRHELTPPKLWIVEAKSSTPRPMPKERFHEFIQEIRDKLLNALSMVLSGCLDRPKSVHPELPTSFTQLDLSTFDARFILVVKGHQNDWLPPLQDALTVALSPTVKTWGITMPAVIVLNDEMARRHNMIQ